MDERVRIRKKMPYIAYPTIILSLFSFSGWLLMFYLYYNFQLTWYLTLPISSLMTYISFTPMHDSVHYSVSKNKLINYIPRLLSSVQFFVSPPSYFRILHLTHHKFTNDPKKDPDYYCSSSFTVCLPFKWLTHVLHYFYFFFTHKELYQKYAHNLIFWIICVWIPPFYTMTLQEFLILWFIPSQIATVVSVYMFDYTPHKPHEITIYEDKYGCTNVIDSVFNEKFEFQKLPNESHLLSILTLNQSYHSIHHLYPYLPFYMYHTVWQENQEKFLDKGVNMVSLV